MNKERINIILAESQGYLLDEIEKHPAITYYWMRKPEETERIILPNYYNSRDALQPVLDGLEPAERAVVAYLVHNSLEWPDDTEPWKMARKAAMNNPLGGETLLNCFDSFIAAPNSTLAIAVIKALGKWEEE